MERPETLIWGYQINRAHCEHSECANLRQDRAQAVSAQRWDLVNIAERALGYCAQTPTEGLS